MYVYMWSLGTSIFRTQVQPEVILDPDYLPNYLSVSYDYGSNNYFLACLNTIGKHLYLLEVDLCFDRFLNKHKYKFINL